MGRETVRSLQHQHRNGDVVRVRHVVILLIQRGHHCDVRQCYNLPAERCCHHNTVVQGESACLCMAIKQLVCCYGSA